MYSHSCVHEFSSLSIGLSFSLTFTALLHTISQLHIFQGRRFILSTSVILEVQPETIIQAVKQMKKKQRDAFLEDLLASTSLDYLASIRDARAQYKKGKVKTLKQVFG